MAHPEDVRQNRIESSRRNGANCEALAAKATADADRERWLSMAQFWRDRANAAEAEGPYPSG
jgi:hypothetical protein